MKRNLTLLWIEALGGSARAYRRLGLIFLKGNREERILAKRCLEKAMGMGDRKGFIIYHRNYSRGREIIDDRSYLAIYSDYKDTRDFLRKKRLRQYLRMGTRRQKGLLRYNSWDSPAPESNHVT